MTNEQKTYVPRSSAKEIKFRNGGSMIKLGFHAESMIAFLKLHANEKGYVNLGITARKTVGERGDTHCVWLDTFQPKPQATPQQAREGFQRARQAADVPPKNGEDDVPF